MDNNNTPAQSGGRFALKTLTVAMLCASAMAQAAPYVENGHNGDPSSWRSNEFKADWGLGAVHLLLGRLVGGFVRTAGDEMDFDVATDDVDPDPADDAPVDDEPADGFVPIDPDLLRAPTANRDADPNSPLAAFDANGNLIPYFPGGGTGSPIFQNGGASLHN